MKLREGAKVSKNLIDQALNNPDFRMGFEAEFYVAGADEFMEEFSTSDAQEWEGWNIKKLSDVTYRDLIRHFEPVPGTWTGDDPKEKIDKNIASIYLDEYDGEFDAEPDYDPEQSFNYLREKFKPYHLITLLGVFPIYGFRDLSEQEEQRIHNLIRKKNVFQMTGYKDLDNQYFVFPKADESSKPTLSTTALKDFMSVFAERLSETLGEKVKYEDDSGSIRAKGYETWYLTHDISLGDPSHIGVELISPPKQLAEAVEALRTVFGSMDSLGSIMPHTEAFTTSETGFHINMSVPEDIDFVKMLFLLGDEYVAQNYDRIQYAHIRNPEKREQVAAQTYLEMVRRVSQRDGSVTEILSRLEKNIQLNKADIEAIIKVFRDNAPREKEYTVNLRNLLNNGYIEFRAPGNKDYEKDVDKILKTVYHYAVTMHIAADPHLYRKEFLKKLYQTAADVGRHYVEKHGVEDEFPRTKKHVGKELAGEYL